MPAKPLAKDYNFSQQYSGTYIQEGYYYIHPILGVVEKEMIYHNDGYLKNMHYSSAGDNCMDVLDSLEKLLKLRQSESFNKTKWLSSSEYRYKGTSKNLVHELNIQTSSEFNSSFEFILR